VKDELIAELLIINSKTAQPSQFKKKTDTMCFFKRVKTKAGRLYTYRLEQTLLVLHLS
jgi:hypothetical protein